MPALARHIHQSLGKGLGVNTMEEKEAKHKDSISLYICRTQSATNWGVLNSLLALKSVKPMILKHKDDHNVLRNKN